MNPPVLGHSDYQIPFFLFVYEEAPSPETWGPLRPTGIATSNCTLWHRDAPLALEPLLPLPFWLRPPRKSL